MLTNTTFPWCWNIQLPLPRVILPWLPLISQAGTSPLHLRAEPREPGKGRDRENSWAPFGFAKAEPVPRRWKLIHGTFFWQAALSVLIKELCDQIEKVAGSCCVISWRGCCRWASASSEPLCSGTKLGSRLAFPCPWPEGNPEQNSRRKSGLVYRCSLNAWGWTEILISQLIGRVEVKGWSWLAS